ncbi:hypothetical protein RJ640_010982 [Escallonia rubra]|uniref:DNA ligase n=1 Tax=Escallonia rubra TaxID=112253 RepID=A0AA88RHT7_9ASTE|nr:hypothetical protein RJ640_010982 [Escallonia rubra]
MSHETLTVDSTTLYLTALATLSALPPQSLSSPLPPPPTSLPPSKLIPKTRFVIDGFRFSGDHSVSYFLSHFHSDHYTGLNPNWSKGVIYCSHPTARLIEQILKIPPAFIVPLSLNNAVLIDGCEVTLIDANHCPGAVQFLFKVPGEENGKFEKYVHTGDFRYCESMKLEPGLSEFIGADAVFLDTTYCNPKFVFPSQEESIDYIVGVIERIGVENEGNLKSVLFLVATYVIGKERILLEVSCRCKRKIHVDGRKMSILNILGFGDEAVFTEVESESDVHVVGWNVLGETWPYFRPNFVKMREIMNERGYSKVVGFVPTGWTYEVKRNKFSVRTKDSFEIHLVPYSEHSNYDELREYVKFLKPKHVIPTVGVDVEKLDSKHVNAMQKHFSGLVDEMALKQEFLMGFHHRGQDVNDKRGNECSDVLNKVVDQEMVVTSHEEETSNNVATDNFIMCSPPDQRPGSRELVLLNGDHNEEMLQELRDCLPTWVSQGQMLDLLSTSEANLVEAVSYFYEHETEFHEQVAGSTSACGSLTSSVNDSALPSSPLHAMAAPRMEDLPLSQSYKLSSKVQLNRSSNISPGKRRKTQENKPKKKARINPYSESIGPKQHTITKFFSKLAPIDSQDREVGTLSDQCRNDKKLSPRDATKPYNEKVDQFIQIINGSESSRSYAATIIEETKGDINMALDMYYHNHAANFCEDQKRLVQSSSLVQASCSAGICSSDQGFKVSEILVNVADKSEPVQQTDRVAVNLVSHMADLSVPGPSSGNVTTNLVSLPLEQYSPIEHACWKEGEPAPYVHLARTFNLLEDEKGKIKATAMLCNMFRSLLTLSPEDVLPAVYLCTNKIGPDHESMELNIGGSIVAAALEEACGTSRSKVRDLYNSLGDLGDVAQLCRQTQSLLAPPARLSIQGVFSALQKISEQTGGKSTARKKSLIVNLMRSCRETEMKFLVRTLVRNLRIGAMMRTVLPALAQAVVMTSFRHEGTVNNLKEQFQVLSTAVVEAYNVVPNLDLLVPSLMDKGIRFSSSTLPMVPGIPIKPMLAKVTNGIPQVLKLFQNKSLTCEYKYDGQRAQIHQLADGSVRVFSRNGDETTSRFPDLINIIKESCSPAAVTFILDAEIVAVDRKNGHKLMSFQELSSRERGSRNSLIAVDSIKVDICVFAFDIMFANGEQNNDDFSLSQAVGFSSSPKTKMYAYPSELFTGEKLSYFEYAKEITVEADDACVTSEATVTKMNCFLEDAFRSSCEGIMVKSLDIEAGYTPSKRSDTWLKVKRDYVDGLSDSLDLVPIGAWYGNGRKAGWYSPFLMACYNPDTEEFQSVCRVMSGFSDSFYKEMKELYSEDKIQTKKPPYYQTAEVPDMWFSPELVWAIRGADFTISPVHQAAIGLAHPTRGISIRFPRFIRALSDRKPEECSTATDIAEMFHSQTRKMDVSAEG